MTLFGTRVFECIIGLQYQDEVIINIGFSKFNRIHLMEKEQQGQRERQGHVKTERDW